MNQLHIAHLMPCFYRWNKVGLLKSLQVLNWMEMEANLWTHHRSISLHSQNLGQKRKMGTGAIRFQCTTQILQVRLIFHVPSKDPIQIKTLPLEEGETSQVLTPSYIIMVLQDLVSFYWSTITINQWECASMGGTKYQPKNYGPKDFSHLHYQDNIS